MSDLVWLNEVLLEAGLRVAETPGWKSRSVGPMGQVLGVMCHHTAGGRVGNMPSLETLKQGTASIPGPLAQIGIGRDGTCYLVSAGRCNHAGVGSWKSISAGNTHFIGIEAENRGDGSEPWPPIQLDAYHRAVAAILRRINRSVEWCVAHKEFAKPPGRKIDPNFDMDAFRLRVQAVLDGVAGQPVLVPHTEPDGRRRPTLSRGTSSGDAVKALQSRLGLVEDGIFGAITEAAVRRFQEQNGLDRDGIVGPLTWRALDP
jgi:peptidoglycan hydrolase-like protein with peptidoglycan-binding domain